ncbi:MAG: hypothetical protein ACM3JB_20300 [Acidobacteriaceae bacterium]
MKYESPQLTTLTPAVDAIQSIKNSRSNTDNDKELVSAYEDWED